MSHRGSMLATLGRCLQGAPATIVGTTIAPSEWMDLFELANAELLTPALWHALRAAGHTESLPDDARDYLAMLHRMNGDRNLALRRQATELIGVLNERGIPVALLKGGLSLFDRTYPDPAIRVMRDLDILVPAKLRDASILELGRLGYQLMHQYPAAHHAYGEFARPGDPGCIDLHTEVIDQSHVLPASEVWARAEHRQADGIDFYSPSPTDRVMHNVLHAQIHHLGNFYRGELQLQQVYELAALVRRHGVAINWHFVQRRLRAHRLTTALESHLLAAHHLLSLEWPLARSPTLGARIHYRRCRLQIQMRSLQWLGVPWGNLRGALAWHRMRSLYGETGGSLGWRRRHLAQYIRKAGLGATLGRLLRVK